MAAVLTELLVVHARTAPGTGTAPAHALLQQVLTELTGRAGHRLTRRCATCGGPHGKPLLDDADLHVSLAAAPGLAVVAVTGAGPVGVDVEHVVAADFEGFDEVALGPGEVAVTAAERARAWVRKEARQKATGEGLAVDPRSVDVRRDRTDDGFLLDVALSPGTACAVAVLCAGRPRLRVEERALSR